MTDSERTPTAWELLRAIQSVGAEVARVSERMLTKDRFDEYQRGTDRRFDALEKRQAEWEAKSERAHGQLGERINGVEQEAERREQVARESRAKVWLGVGMAGLGALLSLASALVLRATGGG